MKPFGAQATLGIVAASYAARATCTTRAAAADAIAHVNLAAAQTCLNKITANCFEGSCFKCWPKK